MTETVYAFMYCDCVFESSFATISLHRSKEGAEKAMEAHRAKKKEWHDKMYADEDEDFKFGEFEDWTVEPLEILD
jgi:hypothetical protein